MSWKKVPDRFKMGVHNLWTLLDSEAKTTRLDSLNGQRLAIDASIWLYQFQKAMRDDQGNAIKGAHIAGFVRRIIKLLFLGVLPVFVFDGGVVPLKRRTILERKTKRDIAHDSMEKTAERILKAQLKLHALGGVAPIQPTVTDEYELPVAPETKTLDARIATTGEMYDFIHSQQQRIDFSKVDIDSLEFKALPMPLQHEIILDLKNKSRTPSELRVRELVGQSSNALEFSNNQLKGLIHRATLTDRYHKSLKVDLRRVAGARQREFVLKKVDESKKVVGTLKGLEGFADPNGNVPTPGYFGVEDSIPDYVGLESYCIGSAVGEDQSDLIADEEEETRNFSNDFVFNWKQFAPKRFLDVYPTEINGSMLEKSDAALSVLLKIVEARAARGVQSEIHSYYKDFISKCIELKKVGTSLETLMSTSKKPEIYGDSGDQVASVSDCNNLLSADIEDFDAIPENLSITEDIFVKSELLESDGDVQASILQPPESQEGSSKRAVDETEILNDSRFKSFLTRNVPSIQNPSTTNISTPLKFQSKLPDNQKEDLEIVDGSLKINNAAAIADESAIPLNDAHSIPITNLDSEDEEWEPVLKHDSSEEPSGANSSIGAQVAAEELTVKEILDRETTKGIELLIEEAEEEENMDVLMIPEDERLEFFNDLDLDPNIREQDINETENLILTLKQSRNRQIRDFEGISTDMVRDIQELLKEFGIPYIVAPAEAESQCAYLYQHGLVDGIVTDDSDVFLFGGSNVLRNMFDQRKDCECFRIENFANLGLAREHLVQMAYLLGSDYTIGLKGLGPVLSIEIVTCWQSDNLDGLIEFKKWVQGLQNGIELDSDSNAKKRLVLKTNFRNPFARS